LVGKITFADMTYLMLVGRFPNDGERRMTDALLTILVEHGMVSSVISARLCYSTAPEALQAAVASSILGAGSVHLGSSEWSAKMLVKALPASSSPADLDASAKAVVEQHAKKKKRIAGIGHRTHPEGDPRAVRLFEIARETGVYGRYCDFLQRICKAAETQYGRPLPANVTGAIGAIALDLGLPWDHQGVRAHRENLGSGGPHRRRDSQPHGGKYQRCHQGTDGLRLRQQIKILPRLGRGTVRTVGTIGTTGTRLLRLGYGPGPSMLLIAPFAKHLEKLLGVGRERAFVVIDNIGLTFYV